MNSDCYVVTSEPLTESGKCPMREGFAWSPDKATAEAERQRLIDANPGCNVEWVHVRGMDYPTLRACFGDLPKIRKPRP